ncbi:MAG TPA: hypothetical protein VFB81_14885 [Myxococcales bacterium]|nr:hypothetical protein [Myxococcales bacterium]
MTTTLPRAVALAAAALFAVPFLTGCGPKECKLNDPSTCDSNQTCEAVTGQEKPLCFAPVEVRGKVFDLTTDNKAPIQGAQVTALDENGAPVSSVVTTPADGTFSIRVPSTRSDSRGTPVARTVTLRAAAQDFTPFPSGIRTAVPLDTSTAAHSSDSDPYVLSGLGTDVGLAPVPAGARGQPKITGTVEVDATQKGVLVVAEETIGIGSPSFASAVADSSGSFTIFNVSPAGYTVRGFSRGVNYTPVSVTVSAGTDITDVHLMKATTATATLSSKVQVVAGSGVTSIVLAVKATFNNLLARGEVVPGLRAPEPGTAPNVSGNFTITGIPDGDYAVLAGFENDGEVRDPDPGISGTTIQFISVRDGSVLNPPDGFKVTDAIVIGAPGSGSTPEEVPTLTPTFIWQAYPSTASYTVELINSLGQIIWTKSGITGTQVAYDGTTALVDGQLYQWRATAFRSSGGQLLPTSLTEDLKGVFVINLP